MLPDRWELMGMSQCRNRPWESPAALNLVPGIHGHTYKITLNNVLFLLQRVNINSSAEMGPFHG